VRCVVLTSEASCAAQYTFHTTITRSGATRVCGQPTANTGASASSMPSVGDDRRGAAR
jgi:hypothetical protein